MYTGILLLIVSAVFYYRVGQSESGRGFVWAAVSILMSIITMQVLHFGTTGFLIGQALILAGMTAYNVQRDRTGRSEK